MVGKPTFEQVRVPPGPVAVATVTVPVSEVTTLPDESSTETLGDVVKFVPSSTFPTGWVVKTSLAAAPEVSVTGVAGELVLVKDCQTAVTVKLLLPGDKPVTAHVVADIGDAEVPQVPPGGVLPLAVTKYVTEPVAGGGTAPQVNATVPAPGVAVPMTGFASDPVVEVPAPAP
jgi:hypothetical protein